MANTTIKAPILITGVGRRLGAMLAAYYCQRGFAVIGTYRRTSAETDKLAALGVQLLQADLATADGVLALVKQVKLLTTQLRAVIHNASIWYKDKEMTEQPALLSATLALHVSSPFLLNQQLQPLLLAYQGLRDVVFIGDASRLQGKADAALYIASKAAMESIMRSQAVAFAPHIKVNMLAPGLLAFHPQDQTDYRQQRLAQNLLGVEPGFQVAIDAIDYLLHSPYSTGSCLVVDGGAQLLGSTASA